MLIPGFMFVGGGLAQYLQLKKAEQGGVRFGAPEQAAIETSAQHAGLPPSQTEYVSPVESRYKTGDLVPPSVTDSTTKLLELDSEGQTMTLPKK